MLRKAQSIRRKSLLERSSTLLTVSDNNIEKVELKDYKIEFNIGKTNLGYIYICRNRRSNKLFFMKISVSSISTELFTLILSLFIYSISFPDIINLFFPLIFFNTYVKRLIFI